MAARKTKTATKTASRGAAKPSNSEPPKDSRVNRRKNKPNSHKGEIIAICAVALAILLGIGIYTESGGVAGRFVDGVFKCLFGFGALLIPVASAWLGVTMVIRKFVNPSAKDIGLVTGLFFCVCSMAHVVSGADYSSQSGSFTINAFADGSVRNGGLFGALLGNLLLQALGGPGTYIVIIAIAMVFTILLTDKSVIQGIIFGIDKAKMLRPERKHSHEDADEYEEDDEFSEEWPEHGVAPKPVTAPKQASISKPVSVPKQKPKLANFRAVKDPKKATVTIGGPSELSDLQRKVLLFNDRGTGHVDVEEEQPPTHTVHGTDSESEQIYDEPLINEPYIHEPEITTLSRPEFDDTGIWPSRGLPFDGYGYIPEEEPEGADESHIETAQKSDIELLKEQLIGDDDTSRHDISKPAQRLEIKQAPEPKSNMDLKTELTQSTSEEHVFPPTELLDRNPTPQSAKSRAQILENTRKLEETLKSFGVEAKVIEVSKGPTVTRYELSPGPGVKVSKIAGLADDLALNLAAVGIRIEAPIPGKAAVGIEIPNKEVTTVYLREVIEDEQFIKHPSKLAFALGKDIAGNTVVADIARMPHLLIAGATGSGKSVCVNTLITSILFKADPSEVKLVMIDPKVVELGVYNGIPHLLIPVVTEPKKAAGALNWAVQEMITRYNLFAEASVRDLKGYNTLLRNRGEMPLPQIVIIIDELADLMMVAPGEVEDAICRLAQMARAAGLHLIIATQRPSVDVITGLIKANIPSRLAFAVSSGIDSRTILDTVGAEKLLGKGDMLFYPVGMSKPQRVQGAFVTDKEVENIVAFVKNNYTGAYDQEMIEKITSAKISSGDKGEVDELFIYAAEFVIEKDKASASMLQRQFRIGYNKAARLIEELEARGIVGQEDGSKPRKVLMNSYQWEEYKENL